MPSVSKSQRRLFQMALAYKHGKITDVHEEVKKIADTLDDETIRHYVETDSDLPEKKAFALPDVTGSLLGASLGGKADRLLSVVDHVKNLSEHLDSDTLKHYADTSDEDLNAEGDIQLVNLAEKRPDLDIDELAAKAQKAIRRAQDMAMEDDDDGVEKIASEYHDCPECGGDMKVVNPKSKWKIIQCDKCNYSTNGVKLRKNDWEKKAAELAPPPMTGPAAIQHALMNLDIDKLHADSTNIIKSKKVSKRPGAVDVLNTLEGLKRNELKPADLFISSVPVVPAVFRPFSSAGTTFIAGDANELYGDVFKYKTAYEQTKSLLGEGAAKEVSPMLYKSVKAAFGFGDAVSPKLNARGVKGHFEEVIGSGPKWCYDGLTEVLTEYGWIRLSIDRDWSNLLVATFNEESLDVEWQKPDARVVFGTLPEDKMIRIKIGSPDRMDYEELLVTENHRMFSGDTGSEDGGWREDEAISWLGEGRRQVMRVYQPDNKTVPVENTVDVVGEYTPYHGNVYCLTVPNTWLVVRRRSEYGIVSGNSYTQRKMISKPQDSVGRAVISIDPDLKMDEVGIPENQAWVAYGPYIQGRLVRSGINPADALKSVVDRTDHARRALEQEMKERPVMISRAPAWHKFNYVGAKPKLVQGDSIFVNPYMTTGANADMDGDTMTFHVPSHPDTVKEVYEKLMPSKMLFHIKKPDSAMAQLKHEQILGTAAAYYRPAKKVWNFPDEKSALIAIEKGDVSLSDEIEIGDAPAVAQPALTA